MNILKHHIFQECQIHINEMNAPPFKKHLNSSTLCNNVEKITTADFKGSVQLTSNLGSLIKFVRSVILVKVAICMKYQLEFPACF